MARRETDAILAECLDRLARGESVAACLARYPQHAAELEPALTAAAELLRIGAYRLAEPARAQANARMRRALAARGPGPARSWRIGWARGLAFAAVTLLLVALVGSAAAGSRPGDWAYPFRAAAERAAAGLNDLGERLRFQSPPDFAETPVALPTAAPTPTGTPVRGQEMPAREAQPTMTRPQPTRTPTPRPTLAPTATPTPTVTPTPTAQQLEATATPQPPRVTPTDDVGRRTRTPEPPPAAETPGPGGGGPGPGSTPAPGDDNSGPGSGNTPGPGDDDPGPGGGSGPSNTPEPSSGSGVRQRKL